MSSQATKEENDLRVFRAGLGLDMIGRRIGSWIIERELGRGGMGSVFEARHVSLPARAAVKILSPGLESEAAFRQRFDREAALQAQLKHPNVARVLDYLEDAGQWFLVVEYQEKGSLADLLSRGEKVSRPQALTWARQALAGLGSAHQKGIVHRDVKPANLLLNESNEVVVADFGIARADASPGLTTTGIAVGTPHYMSPEQIVTPERVDRRTDIYSLGIVLYELLAGRKPFDSTSQFTVLQAQVSEPPPPLRTIDPTIPPELEAIVMRALAKKPEDRYADCQAMEHELARAGEAQGRVAPAALSPVVPIAGTVRSSALFEAVVPQSSAVASPGDLRDRRRRSFQWRLLAGVVAVLLVATLIAQKLTDDKAEPIVTVANATSTTGTTSTSGQKTDTGERPGKHGSTPGRPNRPAVDPARPDPVVNHLPPEPHPHQPIVPVGGSPNVGEPQPDAGHATSPDLASSQPPPSPPSPALALPERPRIAVIGVGDPLLAGSLELELERRLASYDVADEHGDQDIDELLQHKGMAVSPRELGTQLLKSGFQILVLLRVEEAERRTQTIGGISGSVKAARMRLNAYLLPANRPLGSGWTEPVEYTELSAAAKARGAFIGPTADLRKAIDDEWARFRFAGAPAHQELR